MLGSSQTSKGGIDRFSNHQHITILLILEALDGLGNKYEAHFFHFEKLVLGLALTKEAQYGLRLEIIRPVPSLHRRRQKNSGSVAFI